MFVFSDEHKSTLCEVLGDLKHSLQLASVQGRKKDWDLQGLARSNNCGLHLSVAAAKALINAYQ